MRIILLGLIVVMLSGCLGGGYRNSTYYASIDSMADQVTTEDRDECASQGLKQSNWNHWIKVGAFFAYWYKHRNPLDVVRECLINKGYKVKEER